MTLAAVSLPLEICNEVLSRFRAITGIEEEVKGSRISLGERGFLFELLAQTCFRATVSVAISALKADPGQDRGDHDADIYALLLQDAVGSMISEGSICASVTIDDGRYGSEILNHVREDIGKLIGPCGEAKLELSHRLAGLQIADVVANTFFTRALPGDRQSKMDSLVRPFIDREQIILRILPDL